MKTLSHRLPTWLLCLLIVLFSLFLSRHALLPVTEDSGEAMTRTLESATADEYYIYLDFGDLRSFHLIRLDRYDVLLDESAWGQEYDLIAAYRPQRRNRSYHDILAMTGPDGTVYLTLAMSEALRQALLPRQLTITLGLDVLFCVTVVLLRRRCKASQSDAAVEATQAEEPVRR
mgnify:CR=1 FL=1